MSQGCSGIDITPLVLSDTFNTWFERTNEIIGSLNDITLLGLDPFADGSNTFSGIKILPGVGNSCFKTIQLVDGPFIGFTSGDGNAGIYGDGSEGNPFRLTLRVGGGESAFNSDDTITGDDMVPVSDTSQGGLFRLAPVSTFITRIEGGNNISAVFENGTYTISYVEVTFNPTFTITPTHTPLREIGVGEVLSDSGLTFGINSGNNNNLLAEFASVNGPIGTNNNGRVSPEISNFPITLNNNGSGSATKQNVTIPHNTDWFNVSNTTITFTASITSADVTTDDPPTPVNPRQSVSRTRTYSFGWRFGGFASPSLLNDGQVQGQVSSFGNMTRENISVWGPSSPQIFQDPTIRRAFTFPITGPQEHYIYFIHSSSSIGGVNDTFGWSPRFYNDAGSFELQGFATELTTGNPIELGGKRYRVWRSVDRFTTTSTFQIGT